MHGRTLFLSLVFLALGASNAVAAPVGYEGETLTFPLPLGCTGAQTRAGGTATEGADYQPPAVAGNEVRVQTTVDTALEGDETFTLDYTGPVGCTAADVQGTIRDVTVSLQDATASEAAGFADVVVTSPPAPRERSVAVSTADGTANGTDYTGQTGRVTLPAGAEQATFRVALVNDDADEPDEAFRVTLSEPTGTAIADGDGTVAIANDDLRAVSVADATVTEGDNANTVLQLPVTLSAPTFRPVTVQFTTLDAFARAPLDFLSRLGAVTIPAGQSAATIELAIVSDDRRETTETFGVLIGQPVDGTVGRGAAVVTINDDDSGTSADDSPPTLRLTRLRRSGRSITLRAGCPRQETRCAGRLTLFTQPDRRARARTLRTERRIGRRSFALRGGQSRTLRVTIPRTIAAAARRSGRLKVRAFTVTRDAAGNVHSGRRSATLRFRR